MRKFSLFLSLLLLSLVSTVFAEDELLSKYTYVPGEQFLISEDLSGTAIGEAPLSLKVNGDADIIMLANEKWLKLGKNAELNLEIPSSVEDLTLDFYLKVSMAEENHHLNIYLLNESKEYCGWINILSSGSDWGGDIGDKSIPHNRTEKKLYNANEVVPIALTIQKERVKLFINKILVMNVAGFAPVIPDLIQVRADDRSEDEDKILVKDLRLATKVPDIASEILAKGKYVSHGIRFDTNSAQIKEESYSVLKQIVDVLSANPDLKLLITGHTDNTGTVAGNKQLSLERAVSVKQYLETRFGVKADRLETAGLGDTEPLSDNKTPQGRAKNRRVEFIKK